ncbi:flagellar FlbD family protein [Vagococcus sp. DIV0080]|uniref:Flagellar FlbD family protein n=1 Tax=Candidatus Vagococcus giribetii TaxID=2230876 RepID=A0ABS3HTI2_9ENTE|nr:flagellar FlbD family protein [Vagococcus sp. DIV0080]MBO0476966.1 flagellar FlbD family protein [Vagococcus sp. DIV0080]
MIKLTGMNNQEFVLNSTLIYRIDQAPDTVITLSDGKTMMVKESIDDVVEKVLFFQKQVVQETISQKVKKEV